MESDGDEGEGGIWRVRRDEKGRTGERGEQRKHNRVNVCWCILI